ncbi:ATP-dependent helicase/nuclease subunit A [Clostridium pascui]|uniref:helicase-exonuclease AddAB subunit AddA n=1 Tax=Clostridium pascui TaxID=46609 RepID=UPI0019570FC5|nr:ATP-dependent helicase/nuclease subunit A [Clostridium pascui]
MGETKWTKEQESAIYTKGCNLLVAAAAGSGKTAVLVERIIKKITDKENPMDIDKLLVVTFTNAAAAEMKERIGEAITKELDKDPDSKVLQRQLTLLSKANITTIHSFCLNVIRNNFHILDIDPSFRVADETETILLKQEALDEIFDESYEEDKVTSEFLSLVESYGGRDDKKVMEMVENLYHFSQSMPWPESWLEEAVEVFNVEEDFKLENTTWADILVENIKIELEGLKNRLKKAVNMLEEDKSLNPYKEIINEDLNFVEDLIKEESFGGMSEKIFLYSHSMLPRKKLDEYLKEIKEKAVKVRNDVKDKLKGIRESYFLGHEDIKSQLQGLYPRMKVLKKLVINFSMRYAEKKIEKNIIDFNDIEHFCLYILTQFTGNNGIIPSSIAVEYRRKFEEVLVDEYQDSNLVQEVILNSVSRQPNMELQESKLTVPNLFMVGDVKQSIYRFRQAKPELFLEKYNTYNEGEGENRKIKLFKNFRSRENVIYGVNFIFKQIMSENLGELDYTDEEALNPGAYYPEPEEDMNYAGAVELHLMEKNSPKNQSTLEGEDVEEETEEDAPDNIKLEANMVCKIIKNLMSSSENPYMVWDKNINSYRRLQYRDIVILMRATKSYAPTFTEEMNNTGIPVFADSTSGYFETSEVKTILALLQVIDNPRQDIPLLAVLRSPIFSFSAEEIIDVRLINKELSFYEIINNIVSVDDIEAIEEKDNIRALNKELIKKIEYFHKKLEKWRDRVVNYPLDQFIWSLYTETGYYGYVGAMPGGIQRQANLRVLFERAKQYESTSYRGLFNFISFMNKLRYSSGDMGSAKIIGENEDVVRIMSIHKSKGLEFPVVILAGSGKQFNLQDTKKSMLFHHQLGFGPEYVDLEKRVSYDTIMKEVIKKKINLETLSEELRILYVAFTRAKEKLIITGMVKDLDKTLVKWFDKAQDEGEKIPTYAVMEGKSYLDWIVPPLTRHGDCRCLLERIGLDISSSHWFTDNSHWKINIWSKEDFKEEIIEREERDILKELEIFSGTEEISKFKAEIERRLQFLYPYKEASIIPAKFSVSEIKRRFSPLDEENSQDMFKSVILKKPLFLEKIKKFTGAEKGTFMHLVMQHLDIANTEGIEDIRRQINLMLMEEFLTEEQAESINIYKILEFLKSDLGQRMKKSTKVKRELPFYIEIPSSELYKELPSDIYKDEKILIQGVIDAFFEEEDELVLLDYKTDYVEEVEEFKKKYSLQLKYYKRALEKITEKKVKEVYIYSFHREENYKM